jgi:hypothetical protein
LIVACSCRSQFRTGFRVGLSSLSAASLLPPLT